MEREEKSDQVKRQFWHQRECNETSSAEPI
jgi:hypothetical protein